MKLPNKNFWFYFICLCLGLGSHRTLAETREQALASQIFTRIAGRPLLLTDPRRPAMEELIRQGKIEEAARFATEDLRFTLVTMRTIAAPLSNADGTGLVGLTDFIVTFMLAVHHDKPVTDLLTADIAYTANPELLPLAMDPKHNPTQPQYIEYLAKISFFNNMHYSQNIKIRFPISSPDVLTQENYFPLPVLKISGSDYYAEQELNLVGYSLINGISYPHYVEIKQSDKSVASEDGLQERRLTTPAIDTAGLLTTQHFMNAMAQAGTNRRIIPWVFERFLCTPLQDIKDPLADTRFVRRDVDRAPGGNAQAARSCMGCHSIVDGMSTAANYFFDGGPSFFGHENGAVDARVTSGSASGNHLTYPQGFIPTDNTWVNLATSSSNQQRLGWRGPTAGRGLKSLGTMFVHSRAFSRCMAKRVFEHVCRRSNSSSEFSTLETLADHLEANNYNLRRVFEKAATLNHCFEM